MPCVLGGMYTQNRLQGKHTAQTAHAGCGASVIISKVTAAQLAHECSNCCRKHGGAVCVGSISWASFPHLTQRQAGWLTSSPLGPSAGDQTRAVCGRRQQQRPQVVPQCLAQG